MGQAPSSATRSTSLPFSQCRWTGCVPPPFFGKRRQRNRDILYEVDPTSSSATEPTTVTTTANEGNSTRETGDSSIEPQHLHSTSERISSTPSRERYTLHSLPFAPKPPDELVAQLVAVDCGMVRIGPRLPKSKKKRRNQQQQTVALRRVCIVDGRGEPLLNETVRVPPPSSSVENHPHGYQTRLARQISDHVLPRINPSGDDFNVGLSPDEVKKAAADLIKDKIVVGHSVDGDLGVLGLLQSHPRNMIRDTAFYPSFLNRKGKSHRLSFLVKERLGRSIQQEEKFHGCEEDAAASLDLYLSDWEKWEEMAACSPLMHTHTSACNLTNNSSVGVTSASVVPREVVTLPQCREAVSSRPEDENPKPVPSKELARNPSKRAQKRRRKRQRRKERRQNKVSREMRKKSRSYVTSILLFPVDIFSSVIFFPLQVIAYACAATIDAARLVAQGPTLAWRFMIVKLGYQAVPKSFPNQRNRQLGSAAKRARIRKRFFCRLLRSFRDCILISHIVFEPVAIVARHMYQEVGINTFNGVGNTIYNHWGVTVTMIAASLLVAPGGDRYTRQSRICILILSYYHIVCLYNSYKRGEWGLGYAAQWKGIDNEDYLSRYYLEHRTLPQDSLAYIYIIYHFTFFSYSPLGWVCKQLRRTSY